MRKLILKAPIFTCAVAGALSLFSLVSCNKNDNGEVADNNEPKFVVYCDTEDGALSVYHGVPSLTEGGYNIGNAMEFGTAYADQMDNGRFYGDETEYTYNKETGFSEHRTLNKSNFTFEGSVGRDLMYDIGDDEIAILDKGGTYYPEDSPEIRVYVANANTFTLTRMGAIPFPSGVPTDHFIFTNGIKAHGNYLVFTYTVNNADWASNDTSYAVILDRSTLNYVATTKDTRTAAIGLSHMFGRDHAEYNGDLYIASSNSNWWGANESKPAGILRIKAGETQFDPTYFVNMTQITGGDYSVYLKYVGNGKAITETHRKDLITQYSDYSGYVLEYWVVDLASGTAEKLDIPLSKMVRLDITNVEGSKYAIRANTQGGTFYYIYDSSNDSLSKGAEYVGGIVYGTATIQ